MSGPSMTAIRRLGEHAVDMLHRVGEIAARRIQHKVIVIVHETGRVETRVVAPRCLIDDVEEAMTIIVIFEDRALAVAA